MQEDKIRIRTEKELDLQLKGLIEIINIISKFGFYWFIGSGALLGAIREQDFIKWDWDVGIDFLNEEFFPKKNELLNRLLINGFNLEHKDFSYKNSKIVVSKYGADYELRGWYLKEKYRLRKGFKFPSAHWEGNTEIILRNHSFKGPLDIEKYLEFNYGENWRVPIRSSNKEIYLNNEIFRRNKLIRSIRTVLSRIKNKLTI